MENDRLRVFSKAIVVATTMYWATYALVQVSANLMLVADGTGPRFIAPISGGFGAFAAFFVAVLIVGRLAKDREGTLQRSLPLPFLAGLITVYASTYLLVRTNGMVNKAIFVWDEATTRALLVSAIYVFFTGFLLVCVRYGPRLGVR